MLYRNCQIIKYCNAILKKAMYGFYDRIIINWIHHTLTVNMNAKNDPKAFI